MRKRLLLLATILISIAGAQPAKTFDVASLKPSDPAAQGGRADLLPGGRVIFRNLPMRFLFEYAYDVLHNETAGEPSWFDERYDIDAIAAGEGEMTDARVKPYLRTVFEKRLKLITHREKRQVPLYDLVVASGGSKLTLGAADEKPAVTRPSAGRVVMKKIPMRALANFLSGQPDIMRRVHDKTGLSGEFDFSLQWTPEARRADDLAQAPSIFTALTEQLGLKLIATKGEDDILVIDSAEKPSEN